MDEKTAKTLREPFPPEQIGHLPRGGIQLSYVGHAATTDRLLQADPAWTWEPLARDEHGLPVLVKEKDCFSDPAAKVGLFILLTVADVQTPGFGEGKNVKEAIGDAIRNAAMRRGVALDLWTKEDLQGSVGDSNGGDSGATARSARPVSQAPVGEPASPTDSPFQPPAKKPPTKKELDALTAIVDELIADGQITPQAVASAAGGEWPAVADTLDRDTCVDLTRRLNTFKANLAKTA